MGRGVLPPNAPPSDPIVFYIIVSCLLLAGCRIVWNRFRNNPPSAEVLILMCSASFSVGLFIMAGLGGF